MTENEKSTPKNGAEAENTTLEQIKITVPYYDKDGKRLKGLELPIDAFGGEIRQEVLFDAIIMYEANKRLGTSNTLTRSYVSGTHRKPWRQKGTGRARAGTNKSPLWRGGGVIFGPHPRDYSYQMLKKQKKLAFRSALLSKFLDREVRVIEDLVMEKPQTSRMYSLLKSMGVAATSCLVGVPQFNENIFKSLRNIEKKEIQEIRNFNAYDLLKNRYLVLTKAAYEKLLEGNQTV
ncbi:MAG: 50S ribosomal protein L4 [Planctomycetota bacterium]